MGIRYFGISRFSVHMHKHSIDRLHKKSWSAKDGSGCSIRIVKEMLQSIHYTTIP